MPPLTFIVWPVTLRASSEARKATMLPMSSGDCSRCIGVELAMNRSNTSRALLPA